MATTISQALARKKSNSPQYDYMWRVELPSLAIPSIASTSSGFIDSITGFDGSDFLRSSMNVLERGSAALASISKFTGGTMDDVSHRVYQIDTPYFQMDTKKITYRNAFWYSASNNDIGSINITIDEYEDGLTYDYLNSWKNLVINPDGSYGVPAAYKRDLLFYRMSSTNLDLHIFKYNGYFINEISNTQNSYEGNGVLQYTAVLTGDGVEYIPVSPAMVTARVSAAESNIILQDWAKDKFRVDGLNGIEKIRMLGEVARLFI